MLSFLFLLFSGLCKKVNCYSPENLEYTCGRYFNFLSISYFLKKKKRKKERHGNHNMDVALSLLYQSACGIILVP